MAKQGYKVMDSDIHVIEPSDLWLKYIEPKYNDQAPQRRINAEGTGQGMWQFNGQVFPAFIDDPARQRAAVYRTPER
ncbi:MAG: hypothetical protein OEU26_22385 [Candidatus Tectomicrobia bacterium]|nr:hypothetical protein [Candidatus Tectomicrobia bacterium]